MPHGRHPRPSAVPGMGPGAPCPRLSVAGAPALPLPGRSARRSPPRDTSLACIARPMLPDDVMRLPVDGMTGRRRAELKAKAALKPGASPRVVRPWLHTSQGRNGAHRLCTYPLTQEPRDPKRRGQASL